MNIITKKTNILFQKTPSILQGEEEEEIGVKNKLLKEITSKENYI